MLSGVCFIATKPVLSAPATPAVVVGGKAEEPILQSVESEDEDSDRGGGQGDIQPVGHNYVEEVSNRSHTKYDALTFLIFTTLTEALTLNVIIFRFVMMMAK